MMGRVYSSAKLTIEWLGLKLEQAIQALHEFNDTELNNTQSDLASFATSLGSVCESAYWDRLWIVQEFVLSRVLELWSGQSTMSGHAFEHSFWITGLRTVSSNTGPSIFMAYNTTLASIRRSQAYKVSETRLQYRNRYTVASDEPATSDYQTSSRVLVDKYAEANCADVRDRIYGLLGLVYPPELDEYPIYPDYTKSASALYVDLVNRVGQQWSDLGNTAFC